MADTSDFGVLRLIVSDTSKAKDVLTKSGVIVKITEVLAVGMDDTPGGAYGIVDLMASAGIDVEYMYACTSSVPGKALMVFKPSKLDEAEAVLSKNHFGAVKPEEIYRI